MLATLMVSEWECGHLLLFCLPTLCTAGKRVECHDSFLCELYIIVTFYNTMPLQIIEQEFVSYL